MVTEQKGNSSGCWMESEMRGRRTQYEIYWEILSFCRTARSFTSIVGRCNLNSAIALEYLQFLVMKGYLTRLEEGDRTLYKTSENAGDYLNLFTKLYRELFDKSPEFKLR